MRSINHQIFGFPEAKIHLESLCELKCDTSINSSYFYGLSRFCQYIQGLFIVHICPKPNDGIVKLIEVQKNLKYFEWKDDFNGDFPREDPYEKILLALEKKADNIDHLRIFFQYVDDFEHQLLQKILPRFHKLKTLMIENEFRSFTDVHLNNLVYRDLETLNIEWNKQNVLSSIVENSGGRLKKILFRPNYMNLIVDANFYNNSLNYILLSNVYGDKASDEKVVDGGDELLKVLINSAPTNLKEIRFFKHFKFSLENLEEFLGNWKGCALTIFTSDSLYEREDYKKLIDKYKDDGVIKDFIYENYPIRINYIF
ncbi:hypothetical protein RIR_jg33316.t1 [Rhizophagus irregularis DAOM 181602=DAOM 197198]|nr:hypothetical protein RIR_jg33316.t1 [Rhizophagus irregularis DAOM 181602=DAOM 197198]